MGPGRGGRCSGQGDVEGDEIGDHGSDDGWGPLPPPPELPPSVQPLPYAFPLTVQLLPSAFAEAATRAQDLSAASESGVGAVGGQGAAKVGVDPLLVDAFPRLYIVLVSLHGLVRGTNMELGRDADTGGQVLFGSVNGTCEWEALRGGVKQRRGGYMG